MATAPIPTAAPMTAQELAELPDDGMRHELVEGVLIMPMSLARLHHRKDVVQVPVTGVPTTKVGLVWPQDADDDRIETFIGVVRGRSANSSRGR